MTRRTHTTPAQPKIEQQNTVAVARKAQVKVKTSSRPKPEPAPVPSPTTFKAPSGKLSILLDHVGQPVGATIDELADATGWQRHTIRAAFSRLRQRGFPIAFAIDPDGRKAYRLDPKEG